MATKNYTWNDVLSMCSNVTNRLVADRRGAAICNLCQNEMWDEYDWRESIATLPPFFLIPNRQDFGPPFSAVPSDFKGLRQVRVAYIAGDPPHYWELSVEKHLGLTHNQQIPHAISYQPDERAFRLFPRVPDSIAAPHYMVEGTYKKNPTRLSNSTLETFLPFDDEHLLVFVEGVKWASWKLSGDARAGGVQIQDNFRVLTGQRSDFQNAIDSMAEDFGLNDGDQHIAPREPLVGHGGDDPWMYPRHPGIY